MTDLSKARLLRGAVALVLRIAGHGDAEAHVAPRLKPSQIVAGAIPESDVTGVPDVFLNVRSDITARWSSALNDAERGARLTGRRWGAVVQARAESGIEDYFVVLSLAGFSDLVKEATSHADLVRT